MEIYDTTYVHAEVSYRAGRTRDALRPSARRSRGGIVRRRRTGRDH